MRIEVTDIWATPSVLHLRAQVWGRDNAWLRFIPIHIPMSVIPSEVRGMILLSEETDCETTVDQPLPFD